MKEKIKPIKSKYESIKEFEEWYEKEYNKLTQEKQPIIIIPSDEDSIDDV